MLRYFAPGYGRRRFEYEEAGIETIACLSKLEVLCARPVSDEGGVGRGGFGQRLIVPDDESSGVILSSLSSHLPTLQDRGGTRYTGGARGGASMGGFARHLMNGPSNSSIDRIRSLA
jgi:hypothetical protein